MHDVILEDEDFDQESPKEQEKIELPSLPDTEEEQLKNPDLPLNVKQERFCQLYASDREFFGNGVQSYLEAYNPSRKNPNWYDIACISASNLLGVPKVFNRINELLEIGGLNDVAVDKQLSFVIHQHKDTSSKVAAIREYNKLRQRIISKMDVTSGGKPIPLFDYTTNKNGVRDNNSNKESESDVSENQGDSRGDISE